MNETPLGPEPFAKNTPDSGVTFVETLAPSDGKHVTVNPVLQNDEPAGELLLDCDDLAMRLASLRAAYLTFHGRQSPYLGGEKPSGGSRDLNKPSIASNNHLLIYRRQYLTVHVQ